MRVIGSHPLSVIRHQRSAVRNQPSADSGWLIAECFCCTEEIRQTHATQLCVLCGEAPSAGGGGATRFWTNPWTRRYNRARMGVGRPEPVRNTHELREVGAGQGL